MEHQGMSSESTDKKDTRNRSHQTVVNLSQRVLTQAEVSLLSKGLKFCPTLETIDNEFKVRFRNHKSAVLTNKTTCELAVHYNRIEHQMSYFEFIVVEKVVNESDGQIDKRLLTRENVLVLPTLHIPTLGPQ